ncbi:MAG: ribosome maturation factor RimP [Polyangiaceae bacterium]|nr:ribosome maturation factor RimP [Polyangiaceae bacterium]
MAIAHERLHGLDRDALVAAVEPVLRAHGVQGVELMWRSDPGGWVLELTVEHPDSHVPGEGITLDLCADISRDLSAALDVVDLIRQKYRLQVGSPGLERKLYRPSDYARYKGLMGSIKLKQPIDNQRVHRGVLQGLTEDGQVNMDTERGPMAVDFDAIESGHLVFDWKAKGSASDGAPGSPSRKAGGGRSAHRPQRSR